MQYILLADYRTFSKHNKLIHKMKCFAAHPLGMPYSLVTEEKTCITEMGLSNGMLILKPN